MYWANAGTSLLASDDGGDTTIAPNTGTIMKVTPKTGGVSGGGSNGSSGGGVSSGSDAATQAPSAACQQLGTCCSTLPSDIESGCTFTVQENNDSACAAALTEFQGEGYCGGTLPADAGKGAHDASAGPTDGGG